MKYQTHQDGEVIFPKMKGYRLKCCDCSLIHRIDFRISKKGSKMILSFRAFRDNRATSASRRKTKIA